MGYLFLSYNINVDPQCHFSSKLSTARLSAVKGYQTANKEMSPLRST